MPIYIKDPDAERLLLQVMETTGAKTKTQTVVTALREKLEREREKATIAEKLGRIQQRYNALPESDDPNFDMKTFSDSLYDQ